MKNRMEMFDSTSERVCVLVSVFYHIHELRPFSPREQKSKIQLRRHFSLLLPKAFNVYRNSTAAIAAEKVQTNEKYHCCKKRSFERWNAVSDSRKNNCRMQKSHSSVSFKYLILFLVSRFFSLKFKCDMHLMICNAMCFSSQNEKLYFLSFSLLLQSTL